MKKPLTDEELDSLLFTALEDEAMAVPASVQHALKGELLKRRKRWKLYWWVPALAGVLQTAAAAGAVQMLFPGSVAAFLVAAAGAMISLSACVLWGITRSMWKEEVEGG